MLYHPTHNHDHFQHFARYELWDLNPNGKLNRKLKEGQKTSFCIIDIRGIDLDRPGSPAGGYYSTCTRNRQGLSVGWGDEYDNTLPDQWIDLGSRQLADGRYALRSIVDPRDLLDEGGRKRESDTRNQATTCFNLSGGEISIRPC